MRNIEKLALLTLTAASVLPAASARAQQAAGGFALERFHAAPPGAGWFLLDELALQGGPGGAVSITAGYAHQPLRVGQGLMLSPVARQAFAEIAMAAVLDRFRLSLVLTSPLAVSGASGEAGGYVYTAPSVSIEQNPDTIADPRLGLDARLFGEAGAALRLGVGAELIVPSGARADYLTDGTYRAMGRLLFAGDRGRYSYAGQLGVHLRPLDDGPIPGSPRGSELAFGLAGGARVPTALGQLVVGPEVAGATAFKALWRADTTGLEALLGSRLEGVRSDGLQYRVKLGLGAGLLARFGTPVFRAVLALELSGRSGSAN